MFDERFNKFQYKAHQTIVWWTMKVFRLHCNIKCNSSTHRRHGGKSIITVANIQISKCLLMIFRCNCPSWTFTIPLVNTLRPRLNGCLIIFRCNCPSWTSTIPLVNTLRPRQNGSHFQTTFSNAFFCMKMYEFRLRFHWSLFLRV